MNAPLDHNTVTGRDKRLENMLLGDLEEAVTSLTMSLDNPQLDPVHRVLLFNARNLIRAVIMDKSS